MKEAAIEGARNLLANCAGLREGEHLVILYEDPALGWYEQALAPLLASVARECGASVTLRQVGGPRNDVIDRTEHMTPPELDVDALCDCCLFLARIGDQIRFDSPRRGPRRVMCYVRSIEMLASSYGRADHEAMLSLKHAVDTTMCSAREISITCPLGTNLRGSPPPHREAPEDVSVLRFPLGVHAPIDARRFAGDVVLARYLTPTGSRIYAPPSIVIEAPVRASVEAGRIVSFAGTAGDRGRVESQYQRVADAFDLRSDALLSWHAGIHPGCQFDGDAADDPDLWSNTVFTNPRFVHFHTCGNEAPGEICWMVLDPTIRVDDIPLWCDGSLQLAAFPETRRCLHEWPALDPLFEQPNRRVGL